MRRPATAEVLVPLIAALLALRAVLYLVQGL